MRLKAQSLGFERDGTAARERVVHAGHLLWVEQVGGLGVIAIQFASLFP